MSDPTSQLSLPPDPDLESGQQVGEYVVDAKLGEGAFGVVFRATHPLIGKVAAIKVLARRFSVDPEMVSRFIAEARAVNQIRHRNIIDIFSFGQLDDGRHYYVMEYLEGETLDARITRDGKLSLAEALPILRGIGRALDAAHAKGIAHRDLKAENVFLANEGDAPTPPARHVFPKLLDFGIAKLLAPDDGLKHKTRTGTPVGTPYYMSPEQCRGRDVDHRTDLYAFGVLSYLLLTGKYPHDADDYMSILMRQLTMHPDPPSSVVPDLPAGIDDAIGWLIAKDPADRPPNLRAAVAGFEAAAEAAGIQISTEAWPVSEHTPSGVRLETQPPNTRSARGSELPAKPRSNPWSSAPRKTERVAPKKSRMALFAAIGALAAIGIALAVIQPWASSSQVVPESPRKTPIVPILNDPPTKPAPILAPEAQTVIVTITGVPEGTEVLVGGMTVGAAPGPVQLPRDAAQLVLTFRADGYKLESHSVTPDHDQSLEIQLKKKPISAPTKKPGKDDIIDVFKTP